MPKHLLLFAAFLALLTAIFYHPIPNPELWNADAAHWAMPQIPSEDNIHTEQTLPPSVWQKELEESLTNSQNTKALSAID